MNSDRYLKSLITEDAFSAHKMAFISGPRQVGKTTLARSLLTAPENEFNWDRASVKRKWAKDPELLLEGIKAGPILLDEIHKDKRWKSRLKGLYDHHGKKIQIMVSGSARMDLYRRGGDSMLGRYELYRLHPFTVGETSNPPTPDQMGKQRVVKFRWQDLLALGGFPEPLLGGERGKAERWSRTRLERILTEDVRDFRNIADMEALKVLVALLPERAGSLLSINNLRQDVGVAYATVRDWFQVLEHLYICFTVRPYGGKLTRTLKSEPKLYLYDIIPIENKAARLENLAALHLLKAVDYWNDAALGEFHLHFVRNKEKEEVDFLILRNKKPWCLIECKSTETAVAPSLVKFSRTFNTEKNFQLVDIPDYDKYDRLKNVHIISYQEFFAGLV